MNVDGRNELASFFAHMLDCREKNKFTDVIVICNDQVIFRCHQLILAATSDYFDAMLGTDVRQTSQLNLPTTIPSQIFGLIVKYMYTGTVTFLNDANVYDLLIAGNILRMGTIEKACHHYLSQKGIPRLWFRRIFKFACSTDDPSLQSTICQFALKKENDKLLSEVTQSEFQVLVSHFRASSPAEEALMVEKILKWTLPSSISDTKSREQVGLNFMNSVKLFPFEHLPKDYAATYFEEMVTNDRPWRLHEGASLGVFPNSCYREHFALHMFSTSQHTPLKLSTLAKKDSAWSSRSLNQPLGEAILHGMRCTVLGDHLYWLLLRAHKESNGQHLQNQFYSCTSMTYFENPEELRQPPFSDISLASSVHMCSDRKSTIFVCASHSNILRSYQCEEDKWLRWFLGDNFFPRAMTWFHHQLYLFGGESPISTVNVFQTLDPRDGRYRRQVLGPENHYAARFECSSHKERLYLASFRNSPTGMMIFDPIAKKAINVKMPQTTFDDECRLASSQDTLWTVNCDTNRSIRVDIFDPYTQTFENVPFDDGLTDPDSHLLDVVVYN